MIPGAVLFDCDGVLVDSEPVAFALLGEELAMHGHPTDRAEMETLFLGGTITGVAEKARAIGVGFAPDWVERFYERLYARLGEGVALFDGVVALLDVLDARGIPYAVGSNGTYQKMTITLGPHDAVWPRLKDRLFSGQETTAPKPAPDLYLAAGAALDVPPADCVVIDDSRSGCRAGIAAGMRVLGFDPAGHGSLDDMGIEVVRSMAEAREAMRL